MNFDEEVLSYDVSRETLQKMKDFLQILLEWNQKINLVSKNAEKELETRHLLDSLQLIDYIRDDAKLLVDIGSGSGFPGIVLAIASQEKFPMLKIVLIESITKKTLYLKDVCKRLNLLNVEVINDRAENIVFKNVDYITARAVASVDKILKCTAGLYSKNTEYVLPKGHTGFAELEEADKNWKMLVDIHEDFYARPFEVERGKEGYVFCLTEIRRKK